MRSLSPIFFTQSKPVWVDDLVIVESNFFMFGHDIRDFGFKAHAEHAPKIIRAC
jgi:hypothetical protein